MKKLFLALGLLLIPSLAAAQTCPTRPTADNSNACASTAFVKNVVAGAIPLTQYYIFQGNASNLATPTLTPAGLTSLAIGIAPNPSIDQLYIYKVAGAGTRVTGATIFGTSATTGTPNQFDYLLQLAGTQSQNANQVFAFHGLQIAITSNNLVSSESAGIFINMTSNNAPAVRNGSANYNIDSNNIIPAGQNRTDAFNFEAIITDNSVAVANTIVGAMRIYAATGTIDKVFEIKGGTGAVGNIIDYAGLPSQPTKVVYGGTYSATYDAATHIFKSGQIIVNRTAGVTYLQFQDGTKINYINYNAGAWSWIRNDTTTTAVVLDVENSNLKLGATGVLGSLTLGNATSGLGTVQMEAGAIGTVTISLPRATDTLVGKATTDTLTNKTLAATTLSGTISGGGNQINNIIIGTTTPLAGFFTTLNASTSINAGPSSVTADSLMTVMGNTAATVAPISTAYLHVVGADTTINNFTMDAFGQTNVYDFRRADGTLASKSAVVSGAALGQFRGYGWDGSNYIQGAGIRFFTAEAWAVGANGTVIDFRTTTIGTATVATKMKIWDNGGLSVGATATATSPGVGAVLADGAIKTTVATASTSKTTGSIIAGGGLGVAGAIFTDTLNIITPATDATHTDNTLCWDTTTGLVLKGSGAIGVCLGTSSKRYKHAISTLKPGLAEIAKLRPVMYRYNAPHGDPDKDLYGFIAEDVIKVTPKLVGLDAKGQPNSVDLVGLIPVAVKAIQELKAANDNLRRDVDQLKRKATR